MKLTPFAKVLIAIIILAGAAAAAWQLGLKGVILSSSLAALSSAASTVLSHIAHECERYSRPFVPPVALITGGHLDVPIGDATGIGGRNQEFALLWGQALGEGLLESKRIVVAAMDSDGTDGPVVEIIRRSTTDEEEPEIPEDTDSSASEAADESTPVEKAGE